MCFIKTATPRKCVHSDSVDLCSILEKASFWWIGFCARDCFKHSEANWRLLPRLFSEALDAGTAPDLHVQISTVERFYQKAFCERSFANLESLQPCSD